ncbi:TIGR01459 family HAD-type hydrolase [Marinobacter sp. 1_MG-2023]|uniref:TIGR01459 family HAD-type hydrolase n=1 Tax=Marinobacter sp. 1_MG-2023 TaxID=3062627 RepID=UPI0026E3D59A|nr:TIGR01459 family HAD-type hydrolase [Marinobacter sp. 1_MG-2023]MDO6822971.1 TIGR01459 family HAD-type hydrolase [Marinobacter sp. 1_MG-2023]
MSALTPPLQTPSTRWAFEAYQRVRPRLPISASTNVTPEFVPSLGAIADQFDGFIFDAFGVLNAGNTALPTAVARFHELQAMGKHCLILSNAATAPQQQLVKKYRHLGFPITQEQLISSRMLVSDALAREKEQTWAVMAPASAHADQLPCHSFVIANQTVKANREKLDNADAILMLSAQGWTEELQQSLTESLHRRSRPVWVANPDLVAPREKGLSLEPGHYAHRLIDATGRDTVFFGKPFRNAFDAAKNRLSHIPASRLLMVGDTLHTDILGGRSSGISTMLVTAHGALKGLDVTSCIELSGIVPDFIAPEI